MTGFSYFLYFRSNVNKKRQKKTAVQCGKQSSFLEKKPRFSTLTFFFHTLKVRVQCTLQSANPSLKAQILASWPKS